MLHVNSKNSLTSEIATLSCIIWWFEFELNTTTTTTIHVVVGGGGLTNMENGMTMSLLLSPSDIKIGLFIRKDETFLWIWVG